MTAYEIGIRAFERGVARNANPYIDDSDRLDWFRGWDNARSIIMGGAR